MKSIMFFLPNLNGGGAERVIVNIIRQLDTKAFDISLVLVDDTGVYKPLIPKYVSVYSLGTKKTIFSPYSLWRTIKKIQPDIVFSTLFRTNIALYIALLGIKKKPFVILRSPNSPKLLLEKQELNQTMMFFLEKAYASADVVLAQTPEMKEEIVLYHNVSKTKVEVLLNPIDIQMIEKKTVDSINPFESEKINVVAAGRLTKQKGFDILITAFKQVVKENSHFVLHIIGKDDGEEENLRRMVYNYNLESNVNFLGFQDNPYKFFFFSDLYVLSSLWEGLPNTVLENLYLRKPIIATRCIPFMDTLIEDKKNGFLVDVSDSEQLARAILDYKDIQVTKTATFFNNGNDINKFLLDIIDKNNKE